MHRRTSKIGRAAQAALLLATLLFALATAGDAQTYRVRPASVRPRPQLIVSGEVDIGVVPTAVNFSLVSGGTALGSTGVTIYSAWSVVGAAPTLYIYGYFASASAALTDGYSTPDLIPSSDVLGQVTTGVPTSFTPFTQTGPFGGAGASLTLVDAFQLLPLTGNRSDVLNLEINLSSIPNLPAGTYSGTLTIQAVMM